LKFQSFWDDVKNFRQGRRAAPSRARFTFKLDAAARHPPPQIPEFLAIKIVGTGDAFYFFRNFHEITGRPLEASR
jgi:hypothetical protein